MAKNAFDTDALISQFETATATGSAKLRQAVCDATLQALQGRELSLKNIRAALASVTQAANAGLAKNMTPALDIWPMVTRCARTLVRRQMRSAASISWSTMREPRRPESSRILPMRSGRQILNSSFSRRSAFAAW